MGANFSSPSSGTLPPGDSLEELLDGLNRWLQGAPDSAQKDAVKGRIADIASQIDNLDEYASLEELTQLQDEIGLLAEL
jgi:hypothetical protein